jgi:hypothetical protein
MLLTFIVNNGIGSFYESFRLTHQNLEIKIYSNNRSIFKTAMEIMPESTSPSHGFGNVSSNNE